MAETEIEQDTKPKKRFPLLVTLLICGVMGAGGFAFIALDPLHLTVDETAPEMAEEPSAPMTYAETAFIALDPLLISLGPNSRAAHLKFTATLDIEPQYEAEILSVKPRIADMIATYLRAVEPTLLEQPSALLTLRAQMLRRVTTIVGAGKVRDLLITEFILN